MAFYGRQLDEIFLIEISYATITGSTVGTGTGKTVAVSPVLSPNGTQPATCQLGDKVLAVITPASVGSMGALIINANVSGPGTLIVDFFNTSGAGITPATGQYQFIIGRIAANQVT